MKILMLCDYRIDRSKITGGTSSAIYNLITNLKKYTSLEITTFTLVNKPANYKEYFDRKKGIGIIRCPKRIKYSILLNYYPEIITLKSIIKRLNPDIVHAQGTDSYATLATTSGKPNVLTIHGIRLKEIDLQRKQLGAVRCFLYKNLNKRNLKNASNIISINKYTNEQIDCFHKAKTWIIRNAIDDRFFDFYEKDRPEVGNILLLGGIRERKDIITTINVICEVIKVKPKTVLNIVGPKEPDYEKYIRDYIAENGLSDAVKIHGIVSEKQLEKLYCNADIFLLTSVEESSPISIVEAMAAGKPVVSTDVGGISEIVEVDVNANLHPAKDFRSIAASVAELICNRGKRYSYSKASYRIAKENWSGKAVALATENMYREILNNYDLRS